MSISFSRYVKIISGVGGGGGVRQRDLIGRLITGNELVSPDAVMEFSDSDGPGHMFGTASEEYLRGLMYFSYVSPTISSAKKISFSRISQTGNGAGVFGNTEIKSLSPLQDVVAGQLVLTLAGVQTPFAGISFAAALSLADVATALQAVIRANVDPSFATAVVRYDAPTRRFVIQLAVDALGTINVEHAGAAATDVGALLGLYASDDALMVSGVAAQSPTDAFNASVQISNNFGSFLFIPEIADADVVAVATANSALNVQFMYCAYCTAVNAVALSEELMPLAGVGLTLRPDLSQFPEMIPMIILAATDYTKRNSVQNFMFKQFGVDASVTDDAHADKYDPLRVNYYGQTATAGQKLTFYQRGKLMGQSTAPVDMNVYGNEMWLKDYAGSQCMSLQLALGQLSADTSGIAQVTNILQPVIAAARFAGVITIGKPLTPVQKVFIESQTGDPLAWNKLQNTGSLLSVDVSSYVTQDGSTEWQITYALMYSKADAVRLITGTHTLI